MTTNHLSNLEIDEISILSKTVRPAVRAAQIAIVKKETTMSEPISFSTFEAACAHLAKAHGMSALDAMSAAAQEHPQLVEQYNAIGTEIAKTAAEAAAPKPISKAVTDWNKCISETMSRDSVGKLAAMEKAAHEFPEAFAKYQEA